jgi:dipeptidyl aminopeptidase/acylaminoacyl peptidase
MRTIVFFLLLFTSAVSMATHEFVSSKSFYTGATNSAGKLSPDGVFFSYIRREEGATFLELADLGGTTAFQVLKLSASMPLQSYQWVSDDTIQINLLINGKEATYLLSFKTVTESGKTRIDGKTTKLDSGYIVSVLDGSADIVIFSKYEKKGERFQQNLYRISLEKLKQNNFDKAELIEKADKGLMIYRYDYTTNRLLAVFYDEDDESIAIKFKGLREKNWSTALSFDNSEYKLSPIGFIDDTHLAVLTNKETDKVALYSFDMQTQTLDSILYQHEEFDLTDATLTRSGEIESVEYVKSGLPKTVVLNAASQKLSRRFEVTFSGNSPWIVDQNEETGRSIIYVAGPNEPGKYYLFDKKSDILTLLIANYPELSKVSFPEHQVLNIVTKDGTKLEAYLTVPKTYSLNTLLVMPHGGPIGVRDYNFFEPNVQYLANRGFTILRVNFRGSEGFGKSFQNDGVGEFGQQIEADISAAVDHVLANNKFDNICAMGSSYGAYSSMMLAIKHPDIYKCVVASYGIYDIPLLFNYSNFRSGAAFSKEVAKVVGENNSEKKSVSPLYLAEAIKVPTLIIAGKKDDISGFEQSNRMRYVLEKLGKSVDTVFYNSVGHGHSNWYGDRHEYAYIVDFLLNTLNLQLPTSTKMSTQSKAALAYDYSVLGDVYDKGVLTPEDPSKAFKFYRIASEYDGSRATYNLATYYQRGDQVEKDVDKAISLYERSAALGYSSAYSRLASLYSTNLYVGRDETKLLEYISKAIEKDTRNTNKNKHKLALFYCTASDEYLSFQKCEDEFRAQRGIVSTDADTESLLDKLRDAIVLGRFNSKERARFTRFAIEAIGINYPEYDFELSEVGIYEFVDSQSYGRGGKYELIDENSIAVAFTKKTDDKPLYFGIRFTPDHPGLAGSDKYTYTIFHWEKHNAEGKFVDYSIQQVFDTAEDYWYSRFVEYDYTPGDVYTLTVYDVAGNVKYKNVFK